MDLPAIQGDLLYDKLHVCSDRQDTVPLLMSVFACAKWKFYLQSVTTYLALAKIFMVHKFLLTSFCNFP